MMNARLWFLIGTIHWFLITLIHPILVDIDLLLGMHSPIGPEVLPDGDQLRLTLMANKWEFGILGETTAWRAFSGFSLWVPISALFFGLINLYLGRSDKIGDALLYRLTILNLAAYASFMILGLIFLPMLPEINGVGGTISFALAAWLMKREEPVTA